jgi:CheY-like chemotaxis protein
MNNAKILLIEDEFYIRDLYKGILESGGFELELAMDGSDGLQKAQALPKLILLDIMLPGINGLEVLKTLKLDPRTKDIPVVLVTNLGQEDVIKEAFDLGAQGYLLKVNLTAQELVKIVKQFLDNPTFKMNVDRLYFD